MYLGISVVDIEACKFLINDKILFDHLSMTTRCLFEMYLVISILLHGFLSKSLKWEITILVLLMRIGVVASVFQ